MQTVSSLKGNLSQGVTLDADAWYQVCVLQVIRSECEDVECNNHRISHCFYLEVGVPEP